MAKVQLFASGNIKLTIKRLCQEIVENYDTFEKVALIGLQPRGIFLAQYIQEEIKTITDINLPLGYLDITFYRDDFRRNPYLLKPSATKIDFIIEDKSIILIDDVLYTGRSIQAALRAMLAFGRPKQVELLVLVDRKYSRHLPYRTQIYWKRC